MKKTLEQLNKLVELRVIEKYAIGGGIAHFYYIEPSVTYDLDIIIRIRSAKNNLAPLTEIYEWARLNNYEVKEEHIIIENIPVQFLPEYNLLIEEAVNNADEITIFDTKTFIIRPEYLMAIMLQTNRSKDRERLLLFFNQANYSQSVFEKILNNHHLGEKYELFKKKYIDE
ncbi:MAG: hypothetical protein AB1521_09785 [Bacteroidota bacterium]